MTRSLRARRWIGPALAIVVALALVCASPLLRWIAIAPRLASDDPGEYMTAHLEALRWGVPLDGVVVGDDLFLADSIVASEPDAIRPDACRFHVTYRSVWHENTGAPPGLRGRYVYVGRDPSGLWHVTSSGTGP